MKRFDGKCMCGGCAPCGVTERSCAIDGCDADALADGWCEAHGTVTAPLTIDEHHAATTAARLAYGAAVEQYKAALVRTRGLDWRTPEYVAADLAARATFELAETLYKAYRAADTAYAAALRALMATPVRTGFLANRAVILPGMVAR